MQESDIQDVFDNMQDGDDHTVILKKGINFRDLCNFEGKGSEFEIDDSAPASYTDNLVYNQADVYHHLNSEVLGLEEEDEVEERDNSIKKTEEKEEEGPFTILARKMQNLTDDGGVKKRVINQGVKGLVPQNVQVIVHYNGYLEHCDEPYDSTRLRKSPLKYVLGCGEMIPGLELGIRTMKKGEEAQFLIQPEYAFGERGCPPRVPQQAHLLFDVELIDWVECTELQEFFGMSREERRTCDYKLVKKVANHFLEEGKSKFNQMKYGPASNNFIKSIRALEPFHPKDEEEENQWRRTMIRLYTNMALCQLKLANLSKVITFANEAIGIDPKCVKAIYYKGKALRKLGEFERAKKQLLKADRLEPQNKDISKELAELEEGMQKSIRLNKAMCQKMFAPRGSSGDPDKESVEKNKSRPKPNPNASPAISEEFKQIVRDRLQSFKADSSLMEIPLPSNSYTEAELDFIEDIANELELDHVEKTDGITAHIRICKRKPEGEF